MPNPPPTPPAGVGLRNPARARPSPLLDDVTTRRAQQRADATRRYKEKRKAERAAAAASGAPDLTPGDSRRFVARGAIARVLFEPVGRSAELVVAGPAGTGKTRGLLEYVHKLALQHPGMRVLLLRQTLRALTASALVTYRESVLDPRDRVTWYGGSSERTAHYQYANGSEIVVGGLDNPEKVMSTEYDLIYVVEATQITEQAWELCSSRVRWGRLPWQQVIGDCNPDRPTHWLRARANAGRTVMLTSAHEDNPRLYGHDGSLTPYGDAYLARLGNLTGVRRRRLLDGVWAAAEGQVYEAWNPALHVVTRADVAAWAGGDDIGPDGVPRSWPRYWSLDFGYTNPFVGQCWALDPDGRLLLYREVVQTRRLVRDMADAMIGYATTPQTDAGVGERDHRSRRRIWNEPRPRAVFADHDAEGRATFEERTGIETTAARKAVLTGIEAVASRLRPAGDGRPRLYVLADALVLADADLRETGRPIGLAEEMESYVWDTRGTGRPREAPLAVDDHSCDAARYAVMGIDGLRAQRASDRPSGAGGATYAPFTSGRREVRR